MQHKLFFAGVARQHGFSTLAAQAALDMIGHQLLLQGRSIDAVFYVYRTTSSGEDTPGSVSERTRRLLAFASADDAMAFAQFHGFRPLPRLWSITGDQLLAILLLRPSIYTLLFVHEAAEIFSTSTLPPGFRLDRTALLEMLQGGISYGQPL